MQLLVECDQQGQRVVRGIVRGNVVDHHSVENIRLCGEALTVDRVRLEYNQRVEQCSDVRCFLDIGQTEIVMIKHSRLLDLDPGNQFFDGLRGVEAHPHGEGVDEQPDHRFDAGERRWPAGHCCTEDNVVGSGQRTEQDRPRALHDRVGGDPESCGQSGERRGCLRRHRHVQLL